MPRLEKVFSIFLASPGDVSDERDRLVEVIADWNRAWSRSLGLRLELLRWEEDAYPDIGEDAQQVINRQIPSDWDIFVGIMWSRFGTPTGRAGSGTQEEFDRALAKHRSTSGGIRLLFYFKDAPIPPSKIDVNQLAQIQEFKQSAQSNGLLTWDFSDSDQFEKLVSLHITKHVQEERKVDEVNQTNVVAEPAVALLQTVAEESSLELHDDFGYFDLLEQFGTKSGEMNEIAIRLAAAQQELAEQSARGRQELDEINADPATVSTKKVRGAIARVAEEMLKFTARTESELPLLRAAIDGSMGILTKLATLATELYPEQLNSTKESTTILLQTLIQARQSTEGFRDSTANLPKMTKELNIAKRRQVAVLNSLVAEFENGERLLAEGLAVFASAQ